MMRIKRWGFGILLFLWASGITLAMAALASLHGISFFPENGYGTYTQGQWTLTHVLGKDCKCSNQVYLHLLKRGPQENLQENIVLLGEMPEEENKLAVRGYHVEKRNPRSIASEKAVGVPFLLITDDKGQTVYAGGYASSLIRETTPIRDLEILNSLRQGKTISELPIFGCAVSQRIRSLIDPFHLKYKESDL